jgi:hypothetical protein
MPVPSDDANANAVEPPADTAAAAPALPPASAAEAAAPPEKPVLTPPANKGREVTKLAAGQAAVDRNMLELALV